MSAKFVSRKIRLWALSAVIAAGVSTGCSTSPQVKEAKYLKRGQSLLAKKDFPRALLEFRNAARAMPKDAEPYYQMGLALLAGGNAGSAVAAFRKATELNPKHAGAQLKLAELMTASRNKDLIEKAADRLRGILAVSPDNTEANDTLALAEWQLGQTDDAARRLEETLQKLPSHLEASVSLARLKLSQKDTNGAEDVLKKAVASAPQSSLAELALGQFYLLLQAPEKAEPEVRKAIQLDERNGSALMALASIQTGRNRLDEAEQTYRQLAALPGKEYKPLHALFLYWKGQRDGALAEFENLAKEDPNDRMARSRLLAAYVDLGKMSEAQNLLAAALKRNAKDTDALFQRSVLSLRAGTTAEAEKDLQQVLHFQPNFAEAHRALAGVYKAEGRVRNERQELNEALRLNPGMLSARLALARNFRNASEAKSAVQLLDQAPQAQKGMLGVLVERNWALLATGDTKELRSGLNQALQVARVPELVLQDGILRMTEKDYPGARADAEEVLRQNPEEVRAARLVADSFVAQKQPAKATEQLTKIATARPKSALLWNLLGQWYLSNDNLTEARKAFESAKSADGKFVAADLALAELDHRENRTDAVRQRLTAIVAADPKNVSALLLWATLEEETGNRAGSITRYRSVLGVDSSNLFALNNLAYMLARERPDEALKFAQQAAEIAPDAPFAQDTLGWVYYHKGLYRMAVNYLKAAVAKEPTPRRQYHLAMCYLKSGDQNLGEKTMQAALRQDPDLARKEQDW